MKRRIKLIVFLSMFLLPEAYAQQDYGNEWINYTQKYYKLSTAQDGLYRITYNELVAAGFPVSSVDPKKIQLYHRGKEQSILVSGQNDARFDPEDYIDFYGTRNDGTLDSELYVTPEAQLNPHYNFYSDTTAYFLTWSLSENGSRMTPFKENNIIPLSAETYQLNEIIMMQTNAYSIGLHYPLGQTSAETYLSAFDYGEGWTGPAFRQGEYRDIRFTGLAGAVKTGPKPTLQISLTGGNNLTHSAIISIGSSQGTLRELGEINFNYHYNTLQTYTLEWSDFAGDELTCRVSIPDKGTADRISVTFAKLNFADNWDHISAPQKLYRVKPTNSNRSYIEIQNVPAGSTLLDISDKLNIVDVGYNTAGAGINAIIQNDANGRTLLLSSNRLQVPKIEAVSMRNIDPTRANYLIITHKSLRKPTGSYQDVPKQYGAYRASSAGGGYDTLVLNIDQLYNTFSYGEYTSLALYRFCRFMAQKGNPEFLFIMGKGLTGNFLSAYRAGNTSSRDLIPSAGYPGTDALYSAGLKNTTYEPAFPVGRVSAETPAILEAYFDKVKETESTPHNALWRKELVHLSGGRTDFEHNLFKNYVNGFKAIAESEMLGGQVVTISKQTNGATELINIAEYVNAGKMLVTFFGHSATSITDIEIGNVSNDALGYRNAGKYPMMIVNGCDAGDMYNTGYGFGEDWIGTPNRGAVGFIANTGVGLTNRLKQYTDILYETAFTDSLFLDKGIGVIQKETAKRFLERSSNSEADIAQVQQMALQGDPAVALFGVTEPDYEINSDNVFTKTPDDLPINAFTEVFDLGLIVQNFGTTSGDSMQVSVQRKVVETGKEYLLDTMVYQPVFYRDTLYFEVPSVGADGFGMNNFTIRLDPLNKIKELDETNNQTTKEVFVSLGGANSLFPIKYAVVNKTNLTLVAQSFDLLTEDRTYIFETDTTDSFMSPAKRSTTLPGNNLAKWSINLFENIPEQDTVTFYWRTKFADPRPTESDIWSSSSFTYIRDGVPGWAMAHFRQFYGNETKNIVLNQETRSWDFEQFQTYIKVKTFGSAHPDYDWENVELTIDNTQYIFPTRLCTDNSMNLVAFDRQSTIPYLALGEPFILDRKNCGRTPQVINNMLKNEIENNLQMEAYIDNVGPGDFVLMFSIGSVSYQTWPASTISKLAEIGIDPSDLSGLVSGEPIIIIGQKGSEPGSAIVVKADISGPAPPEEQEITMDETITGQAYSGTVSSPRIGPASRWVSFVQKTFFKEFPVTDTYTFDIYGIDTQNREQLLFGNIQLQNADLQSVSAALYPYLRLEMKSADQENLTPPQLQHWFVLYDGVPEGILSFKEGQQKVGIEISEGEKHEASFTFENVSDLAFADSLAVEYSLFNKNLGKSFTDTLFLKSLNSGESEEFSVQLETIGKLGANDFKVFVNPYILPEQTYNNNFMNIPEYLIVSGDNINPIMEVTVDGEFIMDGDIVSPAPVIVLRLKDEGSTLLKEDTLGINLYLNEQCEGCAPGRVSFSSPNVIWTPATAESDFTVEYHPPKLADGIYTLRAEAADASGNSAGEPYAVNFEIINESQITNFYPYPNPFSTRTQFVFTLTGSDIPDEIIIEIMTVNGTVVKEITQDEIGPIKIGNNKTEYAWDGKDQFGDQLANGVYLYKVKINNNGEEIKHRSTSADKAFKNGIGKMYLLR